MTTNFPGDDELRETADTTPSGGYPEEDTVLSREAVLDQYQDQYPVIINVFTDYFVVADKSAQFLERYHKYGEGRAEFEGLAAEIRNAIRNPKRSTPLVNAVLGSQLSAPEARSMLSELLDQMLEQGDYSPEAVENAERETKEHGERPDAETMVAYYARRKVAIPVGKLREYEYPLWGWLAGASGVLLFGVLLGYIPWPSWLSFIPLTFLALGVLGVLVTLLAMLGLRDEILHPDKEERRAREKAEYRKKRNEKREGKESLADRVRRSLS